MQCELEDFIQRDLRLALGCYSGLSYANTVAVVLAAFGFDERCSEPRPLLQSESVRGQVRGKKPSETREYSCGPRIPVLTVALANTIFALQVPGGRIPLSIQLPGILMPQGLHVEGKFVWEVIDAILAKFKQLEGIKPDQVRLFKLGDDDSSRTLLDSTKTLGEAGIHSGTKLAVVIIGYGVCQVSGASPFRGSSMHVLFSCFLCS